MARGSSGSSVSVRSDEPGSPVTIGNGLSPTEATVWCFEGLLDRSPHSRDAQPAIMLDARPRRQNAHRVWRMLGLPPPDQDGAARLDSSRENRTQPRDRSS